MLQSCEPGVKHMEGDQERKFHLALQSCEPEVKHMEQDQDYEPVAKQMEWDQERQHLMAQGRIHVVGIQYCGSDSK